MPTMPMRARLDTPRLTLQTCVPEDANELHAIFSDPATHTFAGGPYTDIEQTRDWIRRRQTRRREHGLSWYIVRLRESGAVIGNAGVAMGRTAPHPEFGFEIRRADQGSGYGTEAGAAAVTEAHDVGHEQVWATVRSWNTSSLRALGNIDFTTSHTVTDDRGPLVYLLHRRLMTTS